MLRIAEQMQQRQDFRFGFLMSFIKMALGSKKWTEPLSWFGHKPEKQQQTPNQLREFFKKRAEFRQQKGVTNGS